MARKARRRVAGFLAAARNDNKVSIKALRRLPRAERAPRGTASLPCFACRQIIANTLVQSAPRAATCFFAVIPSVSEESSGEGGAPPRRRIPRCRSDDNKVSNRSVTPFAARGEGGQEDSLAAVFRAPTEHCEYPRTKRAARSDMFFRCHSERERENLVAREARRHTAGSLAAAQDDSELSVEALGPLRRAESVSQEEQPRCPSPRGAGRGWPKAG